MKGLIITTLLLLSTTIAKTQTKPQCSLLLKVDSTLYASTKDETVDSVTICDDGKATAFHSFTAPALVDTKEEPTKWDYSRDIGKEAVSDLLKFLRRQVIARLPKRVNLVKTRSPVDVLMRFTIVDQSVHRTIALQVPAVACAEERPEMPEGVLELMCAFSDLYNRVKTGVPAENSCGCKSLHEMAAAE